LQLSNTAGEWQGKVRIAEHLGSDTFIYAEVEGQGQMTVRVEGEAPRKAGDIIYLNPIEERLHKFDKDGRRIN
jgi:multiple sugar transport system ATP-binding protein